MKQTLVNSVKKISATFPVISIDTAFQQGGCIYPQEGCFGLVFAQSPGYCISEFLISLPLHILQHCKKEDSGNSVK